MNCPEAHDWLQRRLDGEALDGDALVVHLAACPTCREAHATAQRLLDGLRQRVPPAPPVDLAQRIAARVLADQVSRRARRRLVAGAGLTTAALAASVLLALWMVPPQTPSMPGSSRSRTAAVENIPPREAVPSLEQRVSEAGMAVASLTRRAADETVSTTRSWLPDVPLPAAPGPETATLPEAASARSLEEVKQGVSAGFEPVATSARRAFSLFLHELPVSAEAKSGL
jgi:hypothetical protein